MVSLLLSWKMQHTHTQTGNIPSPVHRGGSKMRVVRTVRSIQCRACKQHDTHVQPADSNIRTCHLSESAWSRWRSSRVMRARASSGVTRPLTSCTTPFRCSPVTCTVVYNFSYDTDRTLAHTPECPLQSTHMA